MVAGQLQLRPIKRPRRGGANTYLGKVQEWFSPAARTLPTAALPLADGWWRRQRRHREAAVDQEQLEW